MEITSQFTLKCCFLAMVCSTEYSVYERLLKHIKINHISKFKTICKRAKVLAKSQVGCGYDGRWDKAQSAFRHAWMIEALKDMVKVNC